MAISVGVVLVRQACGFGTEGQHQGKCDLNKPLLSSVSWWEYSRQQPFIPAYGVRGLLLLVGAG